MPNSDEIQKFDVFVSYSSQDKVIADAVVAEHEQAGIRCWYAPRDIKPGADWADSITKAIQDCSLMVLVFSETANRSQRVIDEINFAIDQGKTILPFRIEPYNPTGALSLHLSSRHWLDAYEPSWDVHLEKLVGSVTSNLRAESIKPKAGDSGRGSAESPSRKAKPILRTVVPILVGLVAVSVLGYFGWKWLAGDKSLSPTETAIIPPTTPIATQTQEEEETLLEPTPTTGYTAVLGSALIDPEGITSLDPLLADGSALSITKHLFLSLTKFNPVTAEVLPGAAASWTVSPDGTIYTFTLHPEIPWVQHTLGGETVQVVDEDGTSRFLTAADFEYGFKRICDPRAVVTFANLLLNIVGCSESLNAPDSNAFTPELLDQIGVEAVSDTELIIRLVEPSASFLTKTIHPNLVAVPAWAIEKYGEAWTNPGLMPTNGPFVIDDWVSGESVRLLRNRLLPNEVQGDGNIGTVEMIAVSEIDQAYQLWLDGQIDYSELPAEAQEDHLNEYQDQTFSFNNQVVHYAVFNHDNDAFSNLHLRRAFSASLDRPRFLREVIKIGGIPMRHLAPPGVFGAPPLDQIGIGYDSEYAQNELELAGYPDCEGMPLINFYAYSEIADTYGQEISRFWEDSLGCPEGTINYKGSIVGLLGDEDVWDDWDLIITGWGSDFPDQENWVGTLLSCEDDQPLRSNRDCSEIDELLEQALVETTPSDRKQLYWDIEEAFFGENGTFPIAPLYTPYRYYAARDWIELGQPITMEGFDLGEARLDMDAKLNVLGE